MPNALVDISEAFSVSNTEYSDTPTYSLRAKDNRFLLLSQIALGTNSLFSSNGRLQIKINGVAVTNQSSPLQEVRIIKDLTLDFKDKDFIIIPANGTLEVFARMTSGTGKLQVAVSGTILTPEEYEMIKKKYMGM